MRAYPESTGENLGAGMLTEGSQQIDAIFRPGSRVAEMLLQSHQGFIELLPCRTGGLDRRFLPRNVRQRRLCGIGFLETGKTERK